jgi:hypothetical protein
LLTENKRGGTLFKLVPFSPKLKDKQITESDHVDLQIGGRIQIIRTAIVISFIIQGTCNKVKWPSRNQAPQRKDNLWQHTCFELFLGNNKSEQYLEYNFSPSLDWNATLFQNYRKSSEPANCEPPHNKIIQLTDSRHEYQVTIPLTKAETAQTLNLGITTIIESTDSQIMYYALTHTANKPDFHQRDSFILTL